ncbi:(2Fe-2S) ferredoxin domain-containing protein [Nostoc sp. UHCC 0702]|nr:(2Fe-2S) ferredoxin domain-containing protein [Nostoc sp. UHCC 0702]
MKKLKKYIKRLIKGIIQRFSDNSQQPSPLSSRPSSAAIPTVSPRWESGLVLVCSQCTTERSLSGSHQPSRGATASEDLQNWLKSRLKSEGLWGEFRVVSTSCLGVCPKGRVAVVLGSHAGGDNRQSLIVDAQSDRELLYSRIKHQI